MPSADLAPKMEQSPSVERLFAHRYRYDDLGFLDLDHSPELYRVEHLFNHAALVISGAPWMGKSTVARQLRYWLERQPTGFCFGRYVHLTELDVHGEEHHLPSPWWREWTQSALAPSACWIIDALDEGEERAPGVSEQILREIRELDGAHRARLRILIFSRQRDWLADFRKSVGNFYQLGPIPEYQLAPLHRDAARDLVLRETGSPVAFDGVKNVIERFNLQSLAGYPAALLFLCHQSCDKELSVVTIWRGILEELLSEPDPRRRRALQTERGSRFAAAARIAAVLTLTGSEQVADHSRLPNLPTLAEIFPARADGGLTRRAAQEAFEIGPFRNTSEGGYSFRQRNVQDWMAAFGLARLSLAAVKSALCDAKGSVFPRHRELVALLRHTTEDRAVREWSEKIDGGLPIISDLAGPTLTDSARCTDRLEQLAVEAPSAIRAYDSNLRRLMTPGLGSLLAARLRDGARHAAAKELLLHVAMATDPLPVLPVALELAADASQPMIVRKWALVLVEMNAGDADFLRLAQPVGRSTGDSREEQLLRAGVIRNLVERGLWSIAEAAAHAPPAEQHVVDDRHMLLRLIHERMSGEDARSLLRDRERLGALVIDPFRGLNVLNAAAFKLLDENELTTADQRMLTELALESADEEDSVDLALRALDRLHAAPEIRHRFFEHGVHTWKRNPTGRTWQFALSIDDLRWLLDRARGAWADVPYVWEELYQLARASKEAGGIEPEKWLEVCQLVEEHAPGASDRFEENLKSRERLRQLREMRAAEKREKTSSRDLSDLVIRLLNDKDLSAEERMRQLSQICFEPSMRESAVVGRWENLDKASQTRVRAALREGLEKGSPTPFSYGAPFSGSVLSEAQAFVEALNDPEQAGWLNAELVGRWLPSALFALHGHIPYLSRRCAEADLNSTRILLLDAAELELRSGLQFAVRACQIPIEWWSNPEVARRVASWVEDEALSAEARVSLLELLSVRHPDVARPIATAWSVLPSNQTPAIEALRKGGLNCRLVLDPNGAWPLIEEAFRHGGPDALLVFPSLYQHHAELRVNLPAWSTKQLEALGQLLVKAFPLAGDPEEQSGAVTPSFQLRSVRDWVIGLLLESDTVDSRAALKRLKASDAGLRRRLRDYSARRKAEKIISRLPEAPQDDQSSVPLIEAMDLLDRTDYRLVRSADDLLNAVLTVLKEVDRDVAADLPLLYGRPRRQRNRRERPLPREHLEEDALQTYVRRRLSDLLPRYVRDVQVSFLREDRVRYRRRLDIRVLAPCLITRKIATVIIELKWSDNPETASHLVKQLGRKYLLGERISHGIYLIGWCGKWKRGRTTRQHSDRKGLEDYLVQQRDEYRVAGRGEGLTIEPIVLGLEWSDAPPQVVRRSRVRAQVKGRRGTSKRIPKSSAKLRASRPRLSRQKKGGVQAQRAR